MKYLGSIIRKYNPDLIALQECNSSLNLLILSQDWAKEYYVSDPQGKEFKGYGNLLLSKYKFIEIGLKDFPSNLGRKFLIGNILYKNNKNLTKIISIVTFHLESYEQDVEFRKKTN